MKMDHSKDRMDVVVSFAQECRGLLMEAVETGKVLSDFGKDMFISKICRPVGTWVRFSGMDTGSEQPFTYYGCSNCGNLSYTMERICMGCGAEMKMESVAYEGCRNCKHQTEQLRACERNERHQIHQVDICSRWEMKEE